MTSTINLKLNVYQQVECAPQQVLHLWVLPSWPLHRLAVPRSSWSVAETSTCWRWSRQELAERLAEEDSLGLWRVLRVPLQIPTLRWMLLPESEEVKPERLNLVLGPRPYLPRVTLRPWMVKHSEAESAPRRELPVLNWLSGLQSGLVSETLAWSLAARQVWEEPLAWLVPVMLSVVVLVEQSLSLELLETCPGVLLISEGSASPSWNSCPCSFPWILCSCHFAFLSCSLISHRPCDSP